MSSSTPSLRFLLDENVRIELDQWLRAEGWDVKRFPPSTNDEVLAACSKAEARVIVTNDEDFCWYRPGEVCGVVWLRIPQSDEAALVRSFRKLITAAPVLKDRLTVLHVGKWLSVPLGASARLSPGIRMIKYG